MAVRIREKACGGFALERFARVEAGNEAGYRPGYFMSAEIVYEYTHYDTRDQAEAALIKHIAINDM
ncbi:MAG: hypothetical protein QXI16_01915 [Sulfolobaceae archaeon]